MSEARLADSRPALIHAMQANYVAYFRQFVGLPGMMLHEDEDVSWFVAQGAPGQHVLRSRFRPETVRARISQTLAQLERRTDRFRWLLFETATPEYLPQLLLEAGLKYDTGNPWMVADLTTIPDLGPLPDDFHIQRIYDADGLDKWMHVSAAGYAMPLSVATVWRDAYLARGFALESNSVHLLGYQGSEPACVATLLLSDSIAGIFDVATPPRFRRQGFASALTHTAMTWAHAMGYGYACLQSSGMGYNMYSKLGFDLVFVEEVYEWRR